jgi:hypothetical protein
MVRGHHVLRMGRIHFAKYSYILKKVRTSAGVGAPRLELFVGVGGGWGALLGLQPLRPQPLDRFVYSLFERERSLADHFEGFVHGCRVIAGHAAVARGSQVKLLSTHGGDRIPGQGDESQQWAGDLRGRTSAEHNTEARCIDCARSYPSIYPKSNIQLQPLPPPAGAVTQSAKQENGQMND